MEYKSIELDKLTLDQLLNEMEYNDGIDIAAVREEIKKRAGVVNLSNLVRLQKGIKKIRGIQIMAHQIHTISKIIDVAYCKTVKEMTVDFDDGKNVIVTIGELEALLST
jgi:hypothetical protein